MKRTIRKKVMAEKAQGGGKALSPPEHEISNFAYIGLK